MMDDMEDDDRWGGRDIARIAQTASGCCSDLDRAFEGHHGKEAMHEESTDQSIQQGWWVQLEDGSWRWLRGVGGGDT